MSCLHKWCVVHAGFVAAATVSFVAGLSSENWAEGTNYRTGLWHECYNLQYYEKCDNLSLTGPEYMVWSRALGILVIFILMGAISHYVCTSCCVTCMRKCTLVCHIIMLFGAAATIIVMLFIYIDQYNDTEDTLALTVGYSFYLTVLACLCCIMAGVFALVDMFSTDEYGFQHERLP